jgi:hypothetical protein
MKRFAAFLYLAVFVLSAACYANPSANPAQGDDRGHASLQLGSNKVEVDHGRPVLKGRNPEQMIQPGQTWRMGSGDPTTLSTQGNLKFGDKTISAGKYVLQAKFVSGQDWRLLIESDGGNVVAEVPFTLQKTDKSVETLTMLLEKKDKGGRMVLQWGTLALAADFQPAA